MTRQLTMLVVDDNERLRERLGQAFAERGMYVLLADGHDAAIAAAQRHPIDRAVVDLHMPGIQGLVVVQSLVRLHPDIEIVVFTSLGSVATAIEAKRMGARGYLTKPAHADRILGAFETDLELTST